MKERILIAGLFHETHTFLEERTGLADFSVRKGEEILAARGDGSPMDGFLEVAEQCGWILVPAIDMRAAPGGIVADEVVDYFWSCFRKAAEAGSNGGLSGIFLVLHGAMVSESLEDVEGELLRRMRTMPGLERLPIFGVYDLHANFSETMATHSNCLIAYRENPHTDARESAAKAARLLDRCLTGDELPCSWYRHASIVWPPTGTGTSANPMKALVALARQIEREEPRLLAVNVNAGFSFADTPDTGVSFSVSGYFSRNEADKILAELCREAWSRREEGCVQEEPVEVLFKKILPVREGPLVLAEPSDNIGAGAPGDGTGLLRALIEHGVDGSVVVINDPVSAKRASEAGAGAMLVLAIGGRGSRTDPGPVQLEVEVVSHTDGRFQLEDPQSHLASMRGCFIDMGTSAVVRHQGILILLTTRRTPPFDLGQLRSQGIQPETMKVIGVKAAVAHRRAYDRIARGMFWVDTPGPCSSNLQRLPYRKLRRPIYPLDPVADSVRESVNQIPK